MAEKLTVLIPCKDERMNIRYCIESARPLADEMLVADSGSVDGTQEIVRSLGRCRLIEGEFTTYAQFKNWALPQASHPWVLLVDADERVSEELAAEIKEALKRPSQHLDAYWISFRCYFMGYPLRYAGWNTPALRLVRRDRCRYGVRRVHESMDVDLDRTGQLRGKLLHYSYWTYDQYLEKYSRYTRWGTEELWDQGKRAGWRVLLVRPALRFLHLYVVRKGFLDGLPGLQVCMLTAFFNTFMKQARLWEMEHALPQPDAEAEHVLSLSARQAPTVFGLLAAEQAPRRRESVRRGLAASRGAAQRDEPETHVAPGTTGDGWRKRRAAA